VERISAQLVAGILGLAGFVFLFMSVFYESATLFWLGVFWAVIAIIIAVKQGLQKDKE
jgi:hypothetical protein